MPSYPDSATVLDGLGDKVVAGLSRAVMLTAHDLRRYRETFPLWVAEASERGLANWIHDRIWSHLLVVLDSVPGVTMADREPTREITVGVTYRLRVKRHHDDGQINTYPTPTALEFFAQAPVQETFDGLEEIRLAAGYEWDADTRDMGDAVLSLRDGRENIIWKETLPPSAEPDAGGGVSFPSVPGPTAPTVEGPAVGDARSEELE